MNKKTLPIFFLVIFFSLVLVGSVSATAWNISDMKYVDYLSISVENNEPQDISFNDNGSKLYLVGYTGAELLEYNLSTPYDVSTGVYNDYLHVVAQDIYMRGLSFNNNGSKLYLVGDEHNKIYEYNLSTPYDVSTGIYNNFLLVEDTGLKPNGMSFNEDGSKVYVSEVTSSSISEYDLSTPYDVSTGIYNDCLDLSLVISSLTSFEFKNDGSSIFVLGSVIDKILEYTLSTPYDVSTGVYFSELSIVTNSPEANDILFNNNGTALYISDTNLDRINEYQIIESDFEEQIILYDGGNAGSFDVCDLDSDGDNDIVGADENNNKYYWLENTNNNGTFTYHDLITGVNGVSLYCADINNDNNIDIVGCSEDAGVDYWLENDGSESFTFHSIGTGARRQQVYVGDVDGDGWNDIVTTGESSNVFYYENDGDETFTKRTFGNNNERMPFIYDLDGDLDNDILFSYIADKSMRWLNQTSANTFSQVTIGTGDYTGYSFQMTIDDWDSDGDSDIVNVDLTAGKLILQQNNGLESFTNYNLSKYYTDITSVYKNDMDGDGDNDLVVGGDKLSVFYNTAGTFVEDVVLYNETTTTHVQAEDMNGDGLVDIVGFRTSGGIVYLVMQTGNSYPTINSNQTFPSNPIITQNVTLSINVTDIDSNISWCNFTAQYPNATYALNNVNGTHIGDMWNSTSFNISVYGQYNWSVICSDDDGLIDTLESNFIVTNAPPQITNINITPLLSYANDTLVGECTAVDYEGDNITYSYNWKADGANITLGLINDTTLNLTGNYSVGQVITFECSVFDNTSYNDDSTSVTIQNFNLSVDNLSSDAVANFSPQIGDIINFNADFESFMFDAEYCHVELKPVNSSTVFNTVEGTLNGTSNGTVDAAFTITTAYTTAYKNVSYRVYCNDSQGNYGYSNYSYFTVVDSTEPEFNITGSEILINGTVRANVLVDELNIDVTFTDNNLFQASVNITCEEAGEIYYWEILDINTTSYTHNENFSVAGLDFQICNITLMASDDHTARRIPSYEYVELSNKLKYTTEHDLGITVTSSEEPRSVDTTKLKDRYIFDFEYDEPELTRTYSIETEEDGVSGAVAGEIFVRQSSEYPGHFVIWNDALKRGNWIDFAMENGDDYDYVVNKVSDTKYDVTISHKILAYPEEGMEFSEVKRDTLWSLILDFFTPEKALAYEDATYAGKSRPIFMAKGDSLSRQEVGEVTNRVVFDDEMLDDFKNKYGIKKVKFSSIGGTNINEMRTYFYIGGVFNISSYNKYNGAQFTNFTAQVEEFTIPIAVANYTFMSGNSNYIDNVREGYYDFIFNHTQYINQSSEYNMTSQYDECIQYQANQSTVCGGLATGRYGFSNTADITNYTKIIDNNYATYGYVDSIGLTYIYINYTVPPNVSFAEWVVYAYNNITPNGTASVAIDAEGKTNLTLRMAARTGSGNANLWLQEYNATSAAWENLTYTPNGTYQSKIYEEHIVWYNQTENMIDVVYNTSQSLITFNFYNVKSGDLLDDYTVYVIDDVNNITKEFNVTDGSSGLTVPLNAEIEYEVLFVKEDYVNSTTFHTFSYKEISDVDIYVNYFATITLVDEDILEPFNISVPDKVELQIVCNGTTTTTILSSANEISETVNITDFFVPITCDYRKFKFVSTYSGSTFYRTLLIEYEDSVNKTVYLIDHANSAYVYTAFYIDDLLGLYDNPTIFIRKQIDTGTVTIHSDYTDIEGKVGAYLLENDEYVLEVHSDNRPDEVIGSYSADIGEEKIISLYDVELSSEATGFSQNVRYTINLQNVSNATSIVFAYFDGEDKTTSIQFRVFENRYNDTLLYTSPLYTNTSQFGHLVWDITGYENSTLVGELIIQHEVEGEVRIARTVKKEWSLALPLMDYVSQEFMNWFFTITLSIVAIMASANMSFATLAIIGLAVLFVLFGWYGLSFTALGFALLVALIEMWAKRGK